METILYVIEAILLSVLVSILLKKFGFKPKPPKKYEDYINGENGGSGKYLK
tara:strand:+ start:348 stop:500 length:153 start_codon:yes stop_codon:yes gene_type:complete